jgi:hypothetical protein
MCQFHYQGNVPVVPQGSSELSLSTTDVLCSWMVIELETAMAN